MSETATTPETGVAGQGQDAPSDDIDTEAFDRAPAPEDDDPDADATAATGGEGDDDPDKPKPATEDDDHVEVERNGQKFKVPKALHGELLMQADYTKKTTELAQAARTFEEARTTWESQREQSRAALPEEHAQVAILHRDLAEIDAQLDPKGKGLGSVDWEAFRRQIDGLSSDDPERLKYARLRDTYMALRDTRIDLVDRVDAAKKDLTTKEAERLAKQQEASSADLAKRRQETGMALKAEVPGWNKDVAAKVIEFAADHLGIAPEEMANATDPRNWKLVHEVMSLRTENAALKTNQKQQQTAAGHEKAQQTKPAATPKGGGGQPRDPSTARGDALNGDEWLRRRNAQVAARRGR